MRVTRIKEGLLIRLLMLLDIGIDSGGVEARVTTRSFGWCGDDSLHQDCLI